MLPSIEFVLNYFFSGNLVFFKGEKKMGSGAAIMHIEIIIGKFLSEMPLYKKYFTLRV